MKKFFILFAMLFLMSGALFAQKLSYQAVVRNADNELVYDALVSVEISILDANGTVQYMESQSATTNQNGLVSLIIGEGSSASGSMAHVNWNSASVKTVITLPSGAQITNIMPITAVPYALFAENTGGSISQVQSDWLETNEVSKAFIQNKPTIPTVPTNVGAFQNDVHYVTEEQLQNAGYITGYTETDPTVPAWAKTVNKPVYNYTEIQGTPTSNSTFTNDEHYITINDVPAQENADWNATSGAAQILHKPTIPTAVSQLTNDVNYITVNEVPTSISHYINDANYITINQVPTSISYYTNDAGYLTRDSIVALQQMVNNLVTLVNSLNMRMTQEQFTSTAGQTVFNLQYAPKTDCIIRCYVNGVMVGGNHNGVLDINANNAQQVIYNASFNRNYTLKANDKVTVVYWY